jgi:hypothetical protein
MEINFNGCGPTFRAIRLGVAFGLLLAAGASTDAASAKVGLPLAVRVQRILRLPSGNNDYLHYIGRLIKATIPRGPAIAEAKATISEMVHHRGDLRGIVSAIIRGASPLALRNALLSRVTLNGAVLAGNGPRWQYGTLYDNMLVQAALNRRAQSLWKAGHHRRASQYARSVLLLRCQTAFIEGWRAVLFEYSRFGWAHRYGPMLSKAEIQRGSEYRAAFRARLRLTSVQQMAIDKLWNASHILAVRDGCYADFLSLNLLTDAVISGKPVVPKPSTTRYLHLVDRCIKTAPSLSWRMAIANFLLWAGPQIAEAGREKMAAAIRGQLRKWRQAVRAEHTPGTLERKALLRWIKEAIGP